ncbi:inorganic diphosphatase [Methylobacterium sp. C25]|uniref:inorganic diphosphatase n=1 Tax=Methylobacterium sp. C25 TaxID=2721622 RepID=UPI001F29D86D|nr:inorganic diphosphatase [Methylobacterium sp. C25]MCE4224968.1 inorganic diphosphatase [Methylobacterium sp. C25]
MNLAAIPAGDADLLEVNVVIEVPFGGPPIKYEMDKASGALFVDRFLHTPMFYPGNYGFIPNTLSEDGDPCDVLVASSHAVQPGAIMQVRPVGVLLMEDEHGPDEKIIGVPSTRLTSRYDTIRSHTDLPPITRQQIEHFFSHYKDLEAAKWVKVAGWAGAATARRLVAAAHARQLLAGAGEAA